MPLIELLPWVQANEYLKYAAHAHTMPQWLFQPGYDCPGYLIAFG